MVQAGLCRFVESLGIDAERTEQTYDWLVRQHARVWRAPGGLTSAEVGKREQVCAGAQLVQEEAGERFWLEVDGSQRPDG